jgi:metacaspase-1
LYAFTFYTISLCCIVLDCHSPPQYSTDGKIKEPNLAAEAGRGVLEAVTSYARGDMGGVLRSAMGLVKTATGSAHSQKAEQVTKATRTSPADVVSNTKLKFFKYDF